MTHSITVGGGFETAHRLPQLAGKCESLHGHSWWVDVTITGDELDSDGKLIRFEDVKAPVFGWVLEHLDHGTMLGVSDPLVEPLAAAGTKLYLFDPAERTEGPPALTQGLEWPTVENVAVLLTRVASVFIRHLDDPAAGPLHIGVRVRETRINQAAWGHWI